jgi:heat shock protein HslJ
MNRRAFFWILAAVPLWAMSRKAEHGIEGVKWRLSGFGGTRMAVPANAWMELEGGRLRGNAGCNGLGGSYRFEGASIRFRLGPATMMACPALGLENRFRKTLAAIDRYEIRDRTLILKRGERPLLVFTRDGS